MSSRQGEIRLALRRFKVFGHACTAPWPMGAQCVGGVGGDGDDEVEDEKLMSMVGTLTAKQDAHIDYEARSAVLKYTTATPRDNCECTDLLIPTPNSTGRPDQASFAPAYAAHSTQQPSFSSESTTDKGPV